MVIQFQIFQFSWTLFVSLDSRYTDYISLSLASGEVRLGLLEENLHFLDLVNLISDGRLW